MARGLFSNKRRRFDRSVTVTGRGIFQGVGVSQLYPKFDKKLPDAQALFVCCVLQADAAIALVTDVAGGTKKTSAKPVSICVIYRAPVVN